MKKKFRLLSYGRYFRRWRSVALALLGVALGLLYWNPPQLTAIRGALQMSAGLAALVLVLGLALSGLAWALVDETALVVQLPFWRVRFPVETINATRLMAIEQIVPYRELDDDLIGKSVVVVELRAWPQPRELLQLWLGRRYVMQNSIALLVKDWFAFQQLLDSARTEAREQKLKETKIG